MYMCMYVCMYLCLYACIYVLQTLLQPQDHIEDLAHLRDENFTLGRQLEES